MGYLKGVLQIKNLVILKMNKNCMFAAVGDHFLDLKLIKFGKYFQMGEHLEIREQLKRRLQKVELYNAKAVTSQQITQDEGNFCFILSSL